MIRWNQIARRRAALIDAISRLASRHRRRSHMQRLLVDLTTQQLRIEIREQKRAAR